uniref:Uncharacterized protein n=1 Tax=Rheinheimera sp. BAL341 TaxID=1708203 RepID=A0A486XMH9_9GAMM
MQLSNTTKAIVFCFRLLQAGDHTAEQHKNKHRLKTDRAIGSFIASHIC